MPLLMCPNCNSSMQAVQRNQVEFDMCPSCRGVWLDRGELEKLMALGQDSASRDERPAVPRGDHDHDDRKSYGQHDPRKRHKRFDLFDIFD